jgi:YidC/Oxa1 family membrane protein insertase
MNDQRNLMAAIALSIAVFLLWEMFVAGPQADRERKAREANRRAQTIEQSEVLPKAGVPGTEPASGALSRDAALASGARIAIDSPLLDGSISLQGARFDDLRLKNYRETIDKKSPEITLLSPRGTKAAYYASFGWAATGNVKVPGPDTAWQAEDQSPLTPTHPLTLRWDDGEGLVFIRTIALDDKYMFTITDKVENTGGSPAQLAPYGLIARHEASVSKGQWFEGLLGVFNGSLEKTNYKDIAKQSQQEFAPTQQGGWLGFTDKYWLAALVPDQGQRFTGHFIDRKIEGRDIYQTDFLGSTKALAPGSAITATAHLFAGAKEVGVIDHYADSLHIGHFDLAIDWGWFYFLTRPIFRLLDFYKNLVGNFGIAILLLTVTVRGALFPLANHSYESMSKMRKVQPEMKKIQERFKDDKVKQQEALMELYKKEKVNPLAGCLPLLIQIPFFFALYKVLIVSIEMRHASFFWWIRDLSAPDSTTLFNLFGLIPWTPPAFLHILGVLPLVLGLTYFLQTKMSPPPPDPVQQKVFLLMPVFMMFIMGGYPAGLVVYWAWSTTLAILQQYVIMRRMGVNFEWEKKFPRLVAWAKGLRGKPAAEAQKGSSQQPGE